MVCIVDEHLELRSYCKEDAPVLFGAIERNRAHLRPWLPWVTNAVNLEHAQQFIDEALFRQDSQEALAAGLFHQGNLIGGVDMHNWDHKLKKASIGYWIDVDYEGRGLMTKTLQTFITFLFDKLGLNKVEIHFMPANTRSAAMTERLGATIEGVIRQSYLMNGMLHDLVVAGILKSEWPKS